MKKIDILHPFDQAVATYASKYNLSQHGAYHELLAFALQQHQIVDLTESVPESMNDDPNSILKTTRK